MTEGDKAYFSVVLEEKIAQEKAKVDNFFQGVRWHFDNFPDDPIAMGFTVQVSFPLGIEENNTRAMAKLIASEVSAQLGITAVNLISENEKLKAENKKLKKHAADKDLGQENQ